MSSLARALALPAFALLLQAAAPPPLRQPVKGWQLDYGDTACVAIQRYGTPQAPVTLALRPSPSGKIVRAVIAVPGKSGEPHHFPLTTNIAPAGAMTGLRFASKDRRTNIVWINYQRAALDSLPRAGELAVGGEGIADSRFALPAIAAVLKGLDECDADLRRYWNVDGAGVALSKPAEPVRPLPDLFTSDDYPHQAWSEDKQGSSLIMMMVDEKGSLKDCMVEETSGIATLDAMACQVLIQRAKFRPALDAAGKPARSVLTRRITWRMP
jgi:TonB family protein